jgi:hyperosmotically inducible protein
MKTIQKISSILAFAAIAFGTLTACSSTRTVGSQMDDGLITSKVKSKIAADPIVNPFNIDVDTVDGVVTLRGKVEKTGAKQHAGEIALTVSGVKRVNNDITVAGSSATARRRLSDSAITSKVKTKLAADPEIDPFNIDVDTADGVVTLSGVVAKASARAEAEKLARATRGVKDVRNEIVVRGAN